ncbi:MAG TPA: alpha/beta hydrolase [Kineosporiaceae bacterium]|nr:alpha/beta hydrolase [Kineosporiaceae bacterium]
MTERKPPRVGLISLAVGLAAAGAGAAIGLAAERTAVRRILPREPEEGDYGTLRGRTQVVHTDDGTALHVEVDEPDPAHLADGGRGPAVTLVFSHGYALSQDSWHFQRKALRGRFRMVFWDQRGHGRSGLGPPESATIDRIGDDLYAVLQAVVPQGPLVLIGHSMGGMTLMSLAEKHPELFRERVLGVAFVSTSAGGLGDVTFGLPRLGKLVQRVASPAMRALTRASGLVERGRRIGSDLETVVVRRYSYASPVPQGLVTFTADMIAATQLSVIRDFLPTFSEHDRREALAAIDGIEVLVIVGDSDLLTPAEHSEEIVRRLPGAEFVVVREGGHLLMLEHPDVVSGHLVELVERALRAAEGGHPRRPGLMRRTVTPLRRRRRRRDGAA